MGIPLCVICCFSFAAFNICSFCLIFINLINMCLGVFHLGFTFFGTLWVSWTWVSISFPVLGRFSTIISSSIFSWPFFFVFFFFWNSYDLNVGAFNIVPEVSEVVLISFLLFFLLCFIYFHHSIFHLTYPIFCLSYSTVGFLQSVFDLSYCIFHYWMTFFIYSRSLLNISCIFSCQHFLSPDYLSVTPLCFQDFGLFLLSLFWIIYQVDSVSLPLLFSSVGIYLVPLPAEYFSAFSSCLDYCVWVGLSVFWQSVVPLYCGVSSLWVGLNDWLLKVSWLGKLVSVLWWVELDFFSLECNEVSSNEFWDANGFSETLGSLYIEAQASVPVLEENLRGLSCSGTCWLFGGAWFQCR